MPKVLQETLEPFQYLMAAISLVGIVYLCYLEYLEMRAEKDAVRQGLEGDKRNALRHRSIPDHVR